MTSRSLNSFGDGVDARQVEEEENGQDKYASLLSAMYGLVYIGLYLIVSCYNCYGQF